VAALVMYQVPNHPKESFRPKWQNKNGRANSAVFILSYNCREAWSLVKLA